MNTKLTKKQHSYLLAVHECESVSSERMHLSVLNRLLKMDLLHCFGVESSGKRYIYHFNITKKGKQVLGVK